jgi:hypothetical protein
MMMMMTVMCLLVEVMAEEVLVLSWCWADAPVGRQVERGILARDLATRARQPVDSGRW